MGMTIVVTHSTCGHGYDFEFYNNLDDQLMGCSWDKSPSAYAGHVDEEKGDKIIYKLREAYE